MDYKPRGEDEKFGKSFDAWLDNKETFVFLNCFWIDKNANVKASWISQRLGFPGIQGCPSLRSGQTVQ